MTPFTPVAVADDDLALLTDLYELTMLQAYWHQGMHERSVFSLYFRNLPSSRRFMLACGQQYAAELATRLHFSASAIERLAGTGLFQDAFLDWLSNYRFRGDIWTLPEGTPVFPNEPLMEVEASIAEAQLLESLIMNQVQLETVLASKAVRLVRAAEGRPVVDFGMRRMHGTDAAVRGVRAYRTAGIAGTSNVLGGLRYDLPLRGTMAHSYVLAHDDEREAFQRFAELYPGTTLLVDTHDTLDGVRKVIALKNECPALEIGAIRLDSGDLGDLARRSRALLDEAGYPHIRIVASSGLDEYQIQTLVQQGAPIDIFGVGTEMGASTDAPVLDLSYKLVEYAGKPRVKHSPGKVNLPGRKQVYRHCDADGEVTGDIIARREESITAATPLLVRTVVKGEVEPALIPTLDQARDHASHSVARLPAAIRSLTAGEDGRDTSYPVTLSQALQQLQQDECS
ncbi:nicotinate phosphoribosyltransferase [Aidingimonas lacisalsi]|uniref:nicotinate phosphoribosyltransferase n=1 Tax=Aidingimonas lacisalsi TaxID=2604086 RepID=UPI0011D1F671|nr:nicotinate phosphoribosyltransferase [Aidingimonas lacisalsi]